MEGRTHFIPQPERYHTIMSANQIVIRGAREHNLKNLDLTLPRYKFIVFTGVSGSGKSSLAFDTLFAEGQRRYVESLSAYARQFLGQMEKPHVDYIGGLSPAIAIEQKAVSKNPRSTVGTVTEISDYLRVLYARSGTPYCPNCGRAVARQTSTQIVDQILSLRPETRLMLLAPVVRKRKGTHEDVLAEARASGFVRARVNGVVVDLDQKISLAKTRKHDIDVVVDRLVLPATPDDDFRSRLADSVETALRVGGGAVVVEVAGGKTLEMSEHNACPHCGLSFPDLAPPMFSFNSPLGMCPDCNGLGQKYSFDQAKFVDGEKSIAEGAVLSWGSTKTSKTARMVAKSFVSHYKFSLDTPWKKLPEKVREGILYGDPKVKIRWEWGNEDGGQGSWTSSYAGTIANTERRYHQTQSESMREWYSRFMSYQPCPSCHGARLRPEAAAVRFAGKTIIEISAMSIAQAMDFFSALHLTPDQEKVAGEVIKEIRARLEFLLNVGLHYLTLERIAPSLSGGEGQRIRLASQIGSGLVGVMYILDEPSIGLHARDNRRLLDSLLRLRDLGNTVITVEHDRETIQSADWVVDIGPGAGVEGGRIVAAGTPAAIARNPASLTGRYLRGELKVAAGTAQAGACNGRRCPNDHWLVLHGARHNNLKNINARFPVGLFTCVTGVSGSGKSSLIAETLYPALAARLHGAIDRPGPFRRIEGLDFFDKVVNITQDPIGRTPRSNPATYIGVYDVIRTILAQVPEAKARGYAAGRFSFNVKGGRCEACQGHGQKRVEMHFLPDVWITCDACKGTRFNRETLQIKFKGRSIAEVLDMDVQQAFEFFGAFPTVKRLLGTLHDVGLDYVKLGQSATTLSGGEAQRVKLAKELARVATGRTLYILDEPTTGLHFADIQKLLDVLHRLTDAGNTVIVIEHNLDVIKTADWIVDLGPEGGEGGGRIVAEGAPEDVAQAEGSFTARYVRDALAEMAA
ncbi:MAG TPA: excinuclease ABC subunit UvrA [Anaerolineales bacterium]|nr:excinuclease ABC subunit UvrA [Anaerolineales bacterium]